MAIAIVNYSSAESSTAQNSLACNVPTGVVAGNILVATVVSSDTTGTGIAAQTGWTRITTVGPSGSPPQLGVFYRVATSSEPASYTFTGINTSSGRATIQMTALSGVDTATPLDVAGVSAIQSTAAALTPSSVTTVTANAFVLYSLALNAATSSDITTATGTTKIQDSSGLSTGGRRTLTAYEIQAAAGATTARSFPETGTQINGAWAVTAFRPSSAVADTTAPTVPSNVAATANSATSVTISWTASTDDTGVASYRIMRGGVALTGATAVSGTSFTDTTVSASTAYSYTVSAVDAAGNRSAESTAATVTTPAASDTTAPTVPTNVTATANSATSVTVSWTASTDAVGVASYQVKRGGTVIANAVTSGTTYTDTTASASTTYSYTVNAVDAAGNRSADSSAASVTTPAASDTTAPTVPTNVSATANSATQVTVSWTASTDAVGVASYQVKRGGTVIANAVTTGTSYVDSTVSASTSYSYTVNAVDAAGNRSADSTAATVTTPAAAASASFSRVQYATGGSFTSGVTTFTSGALPTLTTAAKAGNALIGIWAIDKAAGTFTAPSGWTKLVEQSGASTSIMVAGKMAAGGETTATATWTTGGAGYAAIFAEYSGVTGFGATQIPAYSDAIATSMALGPLTATANGRAIAAFSIDSIYTSAGQQSFSPTATGWNTAIVGQSAGTSAGIPGAALVEMPTDTANGATIPSTTFSWVYGDQVAGALILLNDNAASSADTTAPTVPSNVTATANSATQVTVSWTASTDAVGVASYQVKRGGTVIASAVTGTSYVDSSVSASTAYSYTVNAVDAAGNRSADSTAATVTTPAAGVTGNGTLTSRIVGIPTTTTAKVAVKTANATSVQLKVGTDSAVTQGVITSSAVTPDAQGGSFLSVSGLTAGTKYYYRVVMTDSNANISTDTGAVGTFKTAPSGQASFAFNFGSCTNATDSASIAAIAARGDDMFIHLGDLYYNDNGATDVGTFRTQMNNKIQATNHTKLLSTTPTCYIPSDHEGMNNDVTYGNAPVAWTNFNQVYRELWPTPTLPSGGSMGVYYTYTWGRVRFIALDTRSFASDPALADSSAKTRLGATQKQWLKDTITATTEQIIVLVNAEPWIGPAEAPPSDKWMGSDTERQELATFFKASGKNIILLHGDMHAVAADSGVNSPGNIPVFCAAPFNNSSSLKGGPYSAGYYPNPVGATVDQYGRCVVTDTGTNISVAFTGYSSDNTSRITMTMNYTASGGTGGGTGTTTTNNLKLGSTTVVLYAGNNKVTVAYLNGVQVYP